jgi:hypothetical protein
MDYTFNDQMIASLADTLFGQAGYVFAMLKETITAAKEIFGTEQAAINPETVNVEIVTPSEEGNILIATRWDMTRFEVVTSVIRIADNALMGQATLRVDNMFRETYNNFRDKELKAKVRTLFDKMSSMNVSTLTPIGSIYQQVPEENVAPQQPEMAPTQPSADVPKVDAEMVGVQP